MGFQRIQDLCILGELFKDFDYVFQSNNLMIEVPKQIKKYLISNITQICV